MKEYILTIGFGLLMFISSGFILNLGFPDKNDNVRQLVLKVGLSLLGIIGAIGLLNTELKNNKINVSYKTDTGEIVTCEKCWLSVYKDNLYTLTDKEGNKILINKKDIVSK